jgi:hypothetical protein
MRSDSVEECEKANEFQSLSLDVTYKLCLPLLGQTRFRAKKSERASQALPMSEHKIGVASVRGRTGAVVALATVKADNAAAYCATLVKQIDGSTVGASLAHSGRQGL